jgi:hypothetical protein
MATVRIPDELPPGREAADLLVVPDVPDRVTVRDPEERLLRIRGTSNTYRIHLGSASILVEPHGRSSPTADRQRAAAGDPEQGGSARS